MLCDLFSLCSNICHNQFGARGKLICNLQVYLVSNCGNIFMLCPVAPFGSRYHSYAAENMMASVSNGDAESFVSAAWLQQVHACSLLTIYTPSQIIVCDRILSKWVSLLDNSSSKSVLQVTYKRMCRHWISLKVSLWHFQAWTNKNLWNENKICLKSSAATHSRLALCASQQIQHRTCYRALNILRQTRMNTI